MSGPNFYILKLVNKKESRIPPFEEVKEEATRKVVAIKAEEKARQVAEDLLKQIQGGKDIKEVARAAGLSVEETGYFARTTGVIPKIGPAEGFGKPPGAPHGKEPSPQGAAPNQGWIFCHPIFSRGACGSEPIRIGPEKPGETARQPEAGGVFPELARPA